MRAIVFILLVFLIGGTAWADGWVLWEETETSRNGKFLKPFWTIIDAYETRVVCLKELDEWIRLTEDIALREGKRSQRQPRRISVFKEDKSEFSTRNLRCLPAGTDPR